LPVNRAASTPDLHWDDLFALLVPKARIKCLKSRNSPLLKSLATVFAVWFLPRKMKTPKLECSQFRSPTPMKNCRNHCLHLNQMNRCRQNNPARMGVGMVRDRGRLCRQKVISLLLWRR
jgi:hypothetical protein